LEDITIWDKDNQNAVFEIDFWNASPSGTYTDNSAQVSAGDHAKYLGTVKISAADYSTTGAISRVNIKTINMLIKASGSANIFATVKTTGTPTYTTTSALVFSFGFLQD
jgi:hypothetical protein